jgi:hypothetical protein
MNLSRFPEHAAPPLRWSPSWEQLVEELSTPRRTACTVADCRGSACKHKDGACWSPAVFVIDARFRSSLDVLAISCLTLDIDHVSEAALAALHDHLSRYQHMIHATHADRPGDRCLRVVVQLSRPVMPTEWKRFVRAAVALVGVPVDSPTIDIGRLFYLPSRPRDADYYVEARVGEQLDVDAVLSTAAPAPMTCNHQLYDAPCHAELPGEKP